MQAYKNVLKGMKTCLIEGKLCLLLMDQLSYNFHLEMFHKLYYN